MPISLNKSGGYAVLSAKPPAKMHAGALYSILFVFGVTKVSKLNSYLTLTPKPPAKTFHYKKYAALFPDPPVKNSKLSSYTVLRQLNIAVIMRKQTRYSALVGGPCTVRKQTHYSALFPLGVIGSRVQKLTNYVAVQYVAPANRYVTVNVT